MQFDLKGQTEVGKNKDLFAIDDVFLKIFENLTEK